MRNQKWSRRDVLKTATALTAAGSLIIVPCGIFKSAPNPNAARLFQSFFFSAEGQQLLLDTYTLRSFHSQVKERPADSRSLRSSCSSPIRLRCLPRARTSRRAIPSCSRYRIPRRRFCLRACAGSLRASHVMSGAYHVMSGAYRAEFELM